MEMDIDKASVRPGLWIGRSPRCGHSGVLSECLITFFPVEGDGRGGPVRMGEGCFWNCSSSICQGRLLQPWRHPRLILAKLAEIILRSIVGNSPPFPGSVHHKPLDWGCSRARLVLRR